MARNEDPVATGHDLIATDFDAEAFRGFPIVTGIVDYPGHGPRAVFYWLQTVTQERDDGTDVTVVDAIHPPFYSFGHLPTFMDAPANPPPPGHGLARTHLPGGGPARHRVAATAPLTGFSWGYRLRGGGVHGLLGPDPGDATTWATVRGVYAEEFPDYVLDDLR